MFVPDVQLPNPEHDRLVKAAVLHAAPGIIATPPELPDPMVVQNGTFTLLRSGDLYLGLTAAHVVDEYLADPAGLVLQAGNLILNVDEDMVDRSSYWDLAVFNLTPYVDGAPQLKAEKFAAPSEWQSAEITSEDAVSFAGYPQVGRSAVGPGEFLFKSMAGLEPVLSATPEEIKTRLELDKSVVVAHDDCVFTSFGGLSGGPVVVWRDGKPVLGGVIVQYAPEMDLLVARRIRLVQPDGCIAAQGV